MLALLGQGGPHLDQEDSYWFPVYERLHAQPVLSWMQHCWVLGQQVTLEDSARPAFVLVLQSYLAQW